MRTDFDRKAIIWGSTLPHAEKIILLCIDGVFKKEWTTRSQENSSQIAQTLTGLCGFESTDDFYNSLGNLVVKGVLGSDGIDFETLESLFELHFPSRLQEQEED